MNKYVKFFSVMISLIFVELLYSQTVIDFKLKVEKNNFSGYEKLDLVQSVCKGDSIFGIDQKIGCVVSFDKGLTFQKIDFLQQNISELNNKDWHYEISNSISERQNSRKNIFLKDSNLILFDKTNRVFYESNNWKTFSRINTGKMCNIPDEVYQKKDYQYNSVYFFNKECYFVYENNNSHFSIFKSTNFKNWEKLILPKCLDFYNLKSYKNDLYLFTNIEKNKNVLYKYSDGIWKLIEGFSFKTWGGMEKESIDNINFFNDKVFYQNSKPFIFNLKTNKYENFEISSVLTSSVYNDHLFYMLYDNKKVFTFFDSNNETNIELPKIPMYICEVYENFLLIDGVKVITRPNIEFKFKNELEQRDKESKYWVVKSDDKSSLNTTTSSLSNYNVILYADPVEKEYRYNLKSFKNTISNDKSILSIMFGVPTDGFTDSYGNHIISIDRYGKKVSDLYPQFYYNQKEIDIYDCNSNLDQLNSIYFSYRSDGFIELNEIKLENGTDLPKITQDKIPNQFELKSNNGEIETFQTGVVKLGNGIAGFLAESTYDNKTYLFISEYKSAIKYRKIDLTKISSSFINLGITATHGICLKYKGNKNGASYETNFYSISNIIQNDNYIYVFLKAVNGEFVLPITINKLDYSVKIKSNSFFNRGKYLETNRIINEEIFSGEYFYLPFSKEFVNCYKVNDEIKLDVYNKNIEKSWSTTLNDIEIKYINEFENFIIIGGFTKNSGYKGFPNPKIMIVNKMTQKISYSKVIAKKNAMVQTINLDSNNNIVISIGGIVSYGEDYSFYPQIIVDKLNTDGKFVNELFIK